MDGIFDFTRAALEQARVVRELLEKQVPLELPPARRTFAMHLILRIEHGEIFDEMFMRDLDAFSATIRQVVSDGTFIGWEADENHVRGGYETMHLDDRAKNLGQALGELRYLGKAIAVALDASRACANMAELATG